MTNPVISFKFNPGIVDDASEWPVVGPRYGFTDRGIAVRSIQSKMGRANEQARFDTGTLDIVLDNPLTSAWPNGQFTPGSSGAPTLDCPIAIGATHPNITGGVDLFTGTVERIKVDRATGQVTVSCVDRSTAIQDTTLLSWMNYQFVRLSSRHIVYRFDEPSVATNVYAWDYAGSGASPVPLSRSGFSAPGTPVANALGVPGPAYPGAGLGTNGLSLNASTAAGATTIPLVGILNSDPMMATGYTFIAVVPGLPSATAQLAQVSGGIYSGHHPILFTPTGTLVSVTTTGHVQVEFSNTALSPIAGPSIADGKPHAIAVGIDPATGDTSLIVDVGSPLTSTAPTVADITLPSATASATFGLTTLATNPLPAGSTLSHFALGPVTALNTAKLYAGAVGNAGAPLDEADRLSSLMLAAKDRPFDVQRSLSDSDYIALITAVTGTTGALFEPYGWADGASLKDELDLAFFGSGGLWFFSPGGVLTVQTRTVRMSSAGPTVTLAESSQTDPDESDAWTLDRNDRITGVTLTRRQAGTVAVSGDGSQSSTTILGSDAQAQDRADWLTNSLDTPGSRGDALVLSPATRDPLYGLALDFANGIGISTRLAIAENAGLPPDLADVFVESIAHDGTVAGETIQWLTTLQVTSAKRQTGAIWDATSTTWDASEWAY